MKKIRITQFIMLAAVCVALTSATAHAANLSDKDKQFLSSYEKVHTALAADDLGGAKAAAGDLGGEGAELSKSNSLKDARAAFEKLSAKAKQLAAGQPGLPGLPLPNAQQRLGPNINNNGESVRWQGHGRLRRNSEVIELNQTQ
jgi:hypothetical protein